MQTEQYKPPAGVYFLYDQGELVYVGQSNDIYRRISEHSHGRVKPGQTIKQFDEWKYIQCDDEELRCAVEYAFISYSHPKYNEDYRYYPKGERLFRNNSYEKYSHMERPLNEYQLFRLVDLIDKLTVCHENNTNNQNAS